MQKMKDYENKWYFYRIKESQRMAKHYDSTLVKCLDNMIMNDIKTKTFKEADAKFSYNIRKMMDDRSLPDKVVKIYCDAYESMLELFKKKIDIKKSRSPCYDLTFLSLKNNRLCNEKDYSNN